MTSTLSVLDASGDMADTSRGAIGRQMADEYQGRLPSRGTLRPRVDLEHFKKPVEGCAQNLN